MKFGLKKLQFDQIASVFSNHEEIETVILYGSRAKGCQKQYSDIDITIVSDKINLTSLQKIEIELDDLMLPYKFDVSIYKTIENKELLDHINRVGKIIYKRVN